MPVASGPRRLLSYCDDGSSLDLLFDELGLGGGVALHGLPTTHTLSETDPLVAHFRRGDHQKESQSPFGSDPLPPTDLSEGIPTSQFSRKAGVTLAPRCPKRR